MNAGSLSYIGDTSVSIVPGFINNVYQFRASVDDTHDLSSAHAHDYYQLWYTLRGTYLHGLRNREYLLGPGSFVIVPPYCVHAVDTRVSDDSVLYRLEFSEDFIKNTAASKQCGPLFDPTYIAPLLLAAQRPEPYLQFGGAAVRKAEGLLEELCGQYLRQDLFSSMLIRGRLIRFLSLVADEARVQARDAGDGQHASPRHGGRDLLYAQYRTSMKHALDYIHSRYMQKMYLEHVCRLAMMSPRAFTALFRQITGCTLMEYQQYLRIMHARELLSTTDRTQYDIGRSCGFLDTSHFHRTFKKLTGYLPGEYRSHSVHNLRSGREACFR